MQLNINEWIVAPSADWEKAPGSLNVTPGNYQMTLQGSVQSHSLQTGQCLFKLNLDEGGPNAGAVNYHWKLYQGDAEGLGYNGNDLPNTGLSEMQNIVSVAPTIQPFMWQGVIEITTAGDLTLIANVTEQPEGPAETATFRNVRITVVPV